MYRSCSRCGKMHPYGQRCFVARARVYETTEERRQRSTFAWTLKSKEIRERAHYLCEVCRDQGEINYKDIEVHHIVKIREDSGGLLDNENLICLCQEHHKKADRNELPTSYLKALAKKREQGGIYDIAAGSISAELAACEAE